MIHLQVAGVWLRCLATRYVQRCYQIDGVNMKFVVFTIEFISTCLLLMSFSPSLSQISTEQAKNPSDSIYIGSVSAIEVGPNGWIYSLNGTDGVYLSWNNGNSWKQIGGSYKLTLGQCLAVDTAGRLLVGTDNYGILAFNPANGSWHKIDTMFKNNSIHFLTVGRNNHIFYVNENFKVFKSVDAGVHWSKLPIEGVQNTFTIDRNGILYAEIPGEHFISTDDGESWTLITMPRYSMFSTAVDSLGRIYMGGFTGIYLSEDKGRTWKCCYGNDTSHVYIGYICIHIYREKIVFVGLKTGGIIFSSDGGLTWSKSSFYEFCNSPVLCITSNRKGFIFVGTDGSGVYRSTDQGKTWQPVNKGFISVPLGG
jgi:photosystem II stability/assembly factor-like uncharacterized protein